MKRDPPQDICTAVYPWRLPETPMGLGFWPDLCYRQRIGIPALTVVEDEFNFQWILSGALRLEYGDTVARAGAGFLCGIPPGAPVRKVRTSGRPVELLGLCVRGTSARAFFESLGFSARCLARRAARPDDCEAVFREIEVLFTGPHPRDAFRLATLLFRMAGNLCGEAPASLDRAPSGTLADRFHRLVRTQLHQPLGVAAIAEQLHVSQATLFRAVRRATGQSPSDRIEAERLRRARVLLRETDHKVLHVAHECGFPNEKYFMRRFKANTGMTPAAFRRGREIVGQPSIARQ